MPKGKNMKSKGLYTLKLGMDHLVTFVHPNKKVVPLGSPFPCLPNACHINIDHHHLSTMLPSASFHHHSSTRATTPTSSTSDNAPKHCQQTTWGPNDVVWAPDNFF